MITLARVYTNQETTAMYTRMFTRVFQLIHERLQVEIHWKHIHGDGFHAVVMDMDSKQCSGKGEPHV